jgi:hypothetical protein
MDEGEGIEVKVFDAAELRAEVAAVPAPRFFVARHTAPFPRNASNEARELPCSFPGMTNMGFCRG